MTRSALTSAPLHPLLSDRWSPRGFNTSHRLTEPQLTALLEAARWSPSANNAQPWRFVVAQRGDAAFARLVSTLSGTNRRWAGRASALLLVLAETTDETGAPRAYALYDTGQAVAHLVTQAQAEGLSTHQMGGFDKAAAVAGFGIDPRFTPIVVIAVGVRQDEHGLPDDLAEREGAPRHRRPLAELILPTAPPTDLPRTA
ncbi:MAG TPA: nitroreductase family protein [Mycobacteriales bacterium]|jgi:nitroreductase